MNNLVMYHHPPPCYCIMSTSDSATIRELFYLVNICIKQKNYLLNDFFNIYNFPQYLFPFSWSECEVSAVRSKNNTMNFCPKEERSDGEIQELTWLSQGSLICPMRRFDMFGKIIRKFCNFLSFFYWDGHRVTSWEW